MTKAIYWIESPWPGQLAIVARPRGGEWLVDEVRRWQQAGLDVIVSLLMGNERAELGLAQESELVARQGLQFMSFPIEDRQTPVSLRETRNLIEELAALLSEGKSVGVHCRQGVGRSALIAASLLVYEGLEVETAFARIEAARGCAVPDTVEQRQWVARFAALKALPIL